MRYPARKKLLYNKNRPYDMVNYGVICDSTLIKKSRCVVECHQNHYNAAHPINRNISIHLRVAS